MTRPIASKPTASAARRPADSYVRTGDRIPAAASLPGRFERRSEEGGPVDAVADEEAQVVRSLPAGAMLGEAAGPLVGRQEPGVDLGEVEDRVKAAARDDRLVADRLPIPRCSPRARAIAGGVAWVHRSKRCQASGAPAVA